MMKVWMLFILAILGVHAGNEGQKNTPETPHVLCGRVLANARMFYCDSNEEIQKKSPEAAFGAMTKKPEDEKNGWPWFRATRQHALEVGRAKKDPGLVDECCLKPCYISELLNYC